jgi:hypothetical protein
MAGNDSAWNVPVGEVHNDTFTLSRFLEYTDPSIVASFQPITATSLAYLSELPTLFMSELDRDDNRNEFFRIRLGKVSNLSVVAGEIFYTFELRTILGRSPSRTAKPSGKRSGWIPLSCTVLTGQSSPPISAPF